MNNKVYIKNPEVLGVDRWFTRTYMDNSLNTREKTLLFLVIIMNMGLSLVSGIGIGWFMILYRASTPAYQAYAITAILATYAIHSSLCLDVVPLLQDKNRFMLHKFILLSVSISLITLLASIFLVKPVYYFFF